MFVKDIISSEIGHIEKCHIPSRDICIPKGDATEAYWNYSIQTVRYVGIIFMQKNAAAFIS